MVKLKKAAKKISLHCFRPFSIKHSETPVEYKTGQYLAND